MLPAVEPRAVGATCGGVRVWSVYVPNGREVGHPHYEYKLRWLAALHETVRGELADHDRFAVLGDFNIAPTDADVWDPTVFATSTHVTPPERQAVGDLLALGLTDVMPRALKYDTPYTYWDYRAGAFHKNLGMRIDLVLASAAVAGAVDDAYVDREARKTGVKGTPAPSDHAPVVVDSPKPAEATAAVSRRPGVRACATASAIGPRKAGPCPGSSRSASSCSSAASAARASSCEWLNSGPSSCGRNRGSSGAR